MDSTHLHEVVDEDNDETMTISSTGVTSDEVYYPFREMTDNNYHV